MRLHFLGIGSAFAPSLLNTAAFFCAGRRLYLLDCGSTVFGEIVRRDILKGMEEITVMITHLHADHTGSLGTLISYCRHVTKLPVTVAAAEDKAAALLSLNGIPPERYEGVFGEAFDDQLISARFFKVPHTAAMNAYGILLSDGEERVYYSGDGGQIPPLVWDEFLNGGIARLYQDTAFLNDGSNPAHGSYSRFLTLCPPSCRSRFYPMHLDEDQRDRLRGDGFGCAMNSSD